MSNHRVDLNSPLPRYYQVYTSIKDRILGNEFIPGDAIPSERQLALEYGVSRITIVKSLDMLVDDDLIERQHGRGSFVTERRILADCLDECRVAFCVPTPSESFVLSTLLGATRVAMRNHVHLQIVDIGDGDAEVEQIKTLVDRDFAGCILFSRSTSKNAAFYQELMDSHYPFVMIDRYCPEVATDSVIFEDEAATFALTEALIREGHRRIALIISSEHFATSLRNRISGYQKALAAHDILFEESYIGRSLYNILGLAPDSLGELRTSYPEFLDYFRKSAPTAVVALNYYAADRANADLAAIQMALMQAIIEDGGYDISYELKMPLSVITHRPLSLNFTPIVAQAMQSGEELGKQAMRVLFARLSGSMNGAPNVIKIPMTIQ